jgi:hypothetical protein
VSYVLWENADAVALLRAEGARIAPAEPGIARIEIDLPAPPDTVSDTTVHQLLCAVADGVRHVLTRLQDQLVSGRGTAANDGQVAARRPRSYAMGLRGLRAVMGPRRQAER